jgi:pyruvate,water dikinase
VVERWIVDNEPSKRYPIYTRANVGEVFPDPVTPLSATIGINELSEPGWRDAWERFGVFTLDEYDPDNNEIIGVFGGYCYLNVSLSRIVGVRTPGLTPEIIDQTFFGAQPGVPPYQPTPTDENEERTAAVGATLQWILTTESLPELLEDEELLADLRRERPDVTKLADDELLIRYENLMRTHFRRLFARHIFTTYASTVPAGIIQQVCAAVGQPDAALKLMAGVGDVESAAPSYAMWELSRLDPESTAFAEAWDAFVRDYGSRGPNEWEGRSPTWETDQDLAFAAIDQMRKAPERMAPMLQNEARADERRALGAAITEALAGDPETQGQFVAALNAATIFLAGRERSKTNAIKLVHEGRVLLRELGQRMVERNLLDDERDIPFLRAEELHDWLADPAGWLDEIRDRKVAYEELGTIEPPFVFEGSPPPLAMWPKRDSRPVAVAGPGDELIGIPGCPGQATGRARVVLDPHDPTALHPGDILVAPITDPSWTPLFVPAAAVVVDVGAPLSHAIIVSRELGIPCVVSVTDGTRRIPDGALVSVDGDTGIVTVLEV